MLRAQELKDLVRDVKTASTFITYAQEVISSIELYQSRNTDLNGEFEGFIIALNFSIQHTLSRKGWSKF